MTSETLMGKSPCKGCSQEERKRVRDAHGVDCCKAVCEPFLEFKPLQDADNKRREKQFKDSIERHCYMFDRMWRCYRRGK